MNVDPAQAQAYIVNPLTGRKVQFANLFRTHPPTEERVARLREREWATAYGGAESERPLRKPQSRKFLNWRGMPKSSSFSAAMTAWRSSRFLPDTRSCSPWVWRLDALEAEAP